MCPVRSVTYVSGRSLDFRGHPSITPRQLSMAGFAPFPAERNGDRLTAREREARRLAALTPIEFTDDGASDNAYCQARRSVIPSEGSPPTSGAANARDRHD